MKTGVCLRNGWAATLSFIMVEHFSYSHSLSDEFLWKMPPPCFSKERNKGGIFLSEGKFGQNSTNFLVVLQFVFQNFRACGAVFRNFEFFLIDPE